MATSNLNDRERKKKKNRDGLGIRCNLQEGCGYFIHIVPNAVRVHSAVIYFKDRLIHPEVRTLVIQAIVKRLYLSLLSSKSSHPISY